jgi:hypothetical protein
MTNSSGNQVSLSASDWLKVLIFLLVQTAALIGVGVDMRERLVVVETRLKSRDDSFSELRTEMSELRKQLVESRKP